MEFSAGEIALGKEHLTYNKGPVFCYKLQPWLELAPERRKIIRARALALRGRRGRQAQNGILAIRAV